MDIIKWAVEAAQLLQFFNAAHAYNLFVIIAHP